MELASAERAFKTFEVAASPFPSAPSKLDKGVVSDKVEVLSPAKVPRESSKPDKEASDKYFSKGISDVAELLLVKPGKELDSLLSISANFWLKIALIS